MIYEGVLELIGKTPILKLNNMVDEDNLYSSLITNKE